MKLLLLIISILIFQPIILSNEITYPEINKYLTIENNSLIAICPMPIKYETKVYASKSNNIINNLIQCESGGIHDKWGDLNLEYPVYGILQYQERSFNFLAKKSGMKYLDWKNKHDQIWLLNWVIENEPKYLKWWSCYK